MGETEMFRVRCNQGGLFLTADLLVRDDHASRSSDRRDFSAMKKRQYFQPIEDLVVGLDNIASSAVAT